jgi:histidine triad (HIT) family protein
MNKTFSTECIFCRIAQGQIPCEKVWEDENFLAFNDIHPEAPVHIIVIPKWHIEKSDTRKTPEYFWNDFMSAIWKVVAQMDLDQEGYKLVNNGAGYNDLEHEHMHLLSGMPKPGEKEEG